MRISYWSSDVCSSDLHVVEAVAAVVGGQWLDGGALRVEVGRGVHHASDQARHLVAPGRQLRGVEPVRAAPEQLEPAEAVDGLDVLVVAAPVVEPVGRGSAVPERADVLRSAT